MLDLRDGRLSWDDEDVYLMAKVMGPENAVKLHCPYLSSVIKIADHIKLPLSPRAAAKFEEENRFRETFQPMKKLDDAEPRTKGERLFQKHQRADLAYIRATNLPAYLLAHQPGVGKTLIAMQHAVDLAEQFSAKRVLVITPNSAKEQWRDEIIRWTHNAIPKITIVGGKTHEQVKLASTKRGWIIGHWESLVYAREGYLSNPFDLVIADEAHHAQNRKAQRTDTLFDIETIYKLALTAHPYTKSPEDFFAILKFLYPEVYTAYWRYFGIHVKAKPKPFGGYEIIGPKRPKTLKWEIAPFTLRRTKDSLGWQPPARIRRTVHLTARGVREYTRLKRQFFAELDAIGGPKTIVIPSELPRLTRMRQYLVDPGLLGGKESPVKYPIVSEIISELDGPPVIFTQFKQAALRLGAYLEKKDKSHGGYIHGKMPKGKTKSSVKWEFLDGKLDWLIVVMESGGEALNLGKYGYVIYLDLPWHPRGLEQTEGRVDRPEEGTGKRVRVTSYRVVTSDSYEEKMEQNIQTDYENFGKVFTISDLKELFAEDEE